MIEFQDKCLASPTHDWEMGVWITAYSSSIIVHP